MSASGSAPVSSGRLADELGDALPPASSLPAEAFELVERVRELVAAVVMTDVDADQRAAAAQRIAAVTDALWARRRDEALLLVRHPDGRLESMVQAGSGRLNPQAAPVEWLVRPTEPPPGTEGMRGYVCWVASHASGLTGRGRDSRWSTGRRLAVWW